MKKRKALLILSIFITIAACTKKNESPESTPIIDGKWDLYNVSGGFAGINEFYDLGDIVWNFVGDSLFVQNADSISTSGILLENGSYFYSITSDSLDNGTIYVDSLLIGFVDFDQLNLFISQQYVDGYLHNFKR